MIGRLATTTLFPYTTLFRSGYDAAIKSDLRNAATSEETYLTDNGVYTATGVALTPSTLPEEHTTKLQAPTNYACRLQPVKKNSTAGDKFCLVATSASTKVFH